MGSAGKHSAASRCSMPSTSGLKGQAAQPAPRAHLHHPPAPVAAAAGGGRFENDEGHALRAAGPHRKVHRPRRAWRPGDACGPPTQS